MGCCNSTEAVSFSQKENKDKATEESLIELQNCKVDLRLIIPDNKGVAENTELSGNSSSSPTGVNQRSKKSVTFNPISTIKEYRRDSSSLDKNFTTYIISQLGDDDWSDDESDGMNGSDEENNDGSGGEFEQEYEYGYEYGEEGELELAGLAQRVEEANGGGEDWSAELDLSKERILQPSDPAYISGFDFDYEEHEYGMQGEAQSAYAAHYRGPAGDITGGAAYGGVAPAWIKSY
jgi:hypothetical protein